MITLFKPNETDFNHNGLGNLDKNIIEPVIEEVFNGLFSLTFRYPILALHGSEIDGQCIVRAPVPDGPDQLFRVYKPKKTMGYLEVSCYHIFYDLVDNFIEDTNIVGKDGQTSLTQMSSKTQYTHNFKFFSDIDVVAGSRVVRKNPIEFLLDDSLKNSFISRWGGELKRDNFKVFMYRSIGNDNGVIIRHRKDLLGYEAVVDWNSPVTRIMPIGFDGLLLPEKYVDSPIINSYVKPKIQTIEYGDVKAAVGQYADDDEAVPLDQAYIELRRLANLEFSKGKIDYPKASYQINFVTLSKTEEYKNYVTLKTVILGDTVTVVHKEDKLNIKAKVIKYRFDPLTKIYIDIELGNFKEAFSDTQGKIDSIYNRVEEVKQDLTLTIQVAANGKNRIFRGVNTPVSGMSENDLWYKPVGKGETEMYRYNGTDWKIEKVSAGLLGGKLDAENGDVDLINVNVSTLVGNKSNFVSSAWNAINSDASIDGTRLKFTHDDGSYTAISAAGMKRHTAGSSKTYHYLMDVQTFIFGESSPTVARWIQLPPEFKGKNFKVYLAIADSMTETSGSHTILRFVCTVHPKFKIDYANARVPVISYKVGINSSGGGRDISEVQGLIMALY